MKKLLATIILILLTWQTIFNVGFIIYWKVNQTFIIEKLCENKDKPQMHCNGKCYLYKQLQKSSEKEIDKNSLPISLPKFKSVDDFVTQNYDWRPKNTLVLLRQHSFENYSSILTIGCQNTLFRPPKFI